MYKTESSLELKKIIFKKIILIVDISSEKAYFTTFDSSALIVKSDFTKNKVVHLL